MILTNGDSWSGGVRFSNYFNAGSPFLWPNQLQARTNVPVLNLASGASSNHRIFRTTIEQLNIETPECLVIGWSSVDRVELTLHNGDYVKVSAQGAFWPNTENTDYDKLSKDIHELYYSKLFNKKINVKFFLNSVLLLQEFCTLKNIKFVNFQSAFDNFGDARLLMDSEIDKLYQKIDFTKWIYFEDNPTMKTMMLKEGYPTINSYTNEDGQARWSEIISNKLISP